MKKDEELNEIQVEKPKLDNLITNQNMTSITDTIIFKHKYIYNNYIIILNYNKSWDEIVMILLLGDHYDVKFGKIMDENNRSYIAKFMASYPVVIDKDYQILPKFDSINSSQQNYISDLIQKYRI